MTFWKSIMHSCTQILHQNVHFSQIYREVKLESFIPQIKRYGEKKIYIYVI